MDPDDLTADLTPAERAEIERVSSVLGDAAVWAEPSPELQERVVSAIADADAGSGSDRRSWLRYAVPGIAAAAVLAVGIAVGVQQLNGDEEGPVFAAAMSGTELSPDASGDVTLTKTTSGWRIELHATGLPRRADGEFYQAWLKDADGNLVPIGTFNEGMDVVLWAGVPPTAFPIVTITQEVADGDQASSGLVVLV